MIARLRAKLAKLVAKIDSEDADGPVDERALSNAFFLAIWYPTSAGEFNRLASSPNLTPEAQGFMERLKESAAGARTIVIHPDMIKPMIKYSSDVASYLGKDTIDDVMTHRIIEWVAAERAAGVGSWADST